MGFSFISNSAELSASNRPLETKGKLSDMRLHGQVPAVLNNSEGKSVTISINRKEVLKLFETFRGFVSSLIVILVFEDGSKVHTCVKEIQYHPVSYELLHVDFHELFENIPVKINIPVVIKGSDSCVGVKQGGILRQVIRKVRVKCLPNHIPVGFEIDVSSLNIRKSMRLSEIKFPENVKPLSDINQVAVVVGKR